ncbi:hypothetical protein PSI23_18460 [Xenorhabdus sp. XENO-10]|uniref:Phage abortive infection protein n=1 Tax=Xenorhabdus yunnanensis TaxID=3025878 RepID=A0ABT5LJC1_9GAMM|nr:hypothetical protein [Xenorhabdus yunnanensis]MDC9591217.1 hypothetical protein [Xenorhabdus yunnanensis]
MKETISKHIKNFYNKYIKEPSKEYWYLLVLLAFACIPLGAYFHTFNNSLSNNSGDWAAFGSLVGGVWGPLATIGSIIVLIQTLKTMQRNNDNQLREAEITKNFDHIMLLTKTLNDVMDMNPNKVQGVKVEQNCVFGYLQYQVRMSVQNNHLYGLAYGEKRIDNSDEIWNLAYKVVKNKNYFENESIVFAEILRKIKTIKEEDSQKTAKIMLQNRISPDRRFWFYCHCEYWNCNIFNELKSYDNFAVLPTPLQNLVSKK